MNEQNTYKIVLIILIVFCFARNSYCQSELQSDSDSIARAELDFNLVVSANKGDAQTVLYLLEKGANPNACSDNGVSALMYAAQNGIMQVVKTLVANGANIDYTPLESVSALSAAVINNHADIVQYLLQKNANINIADNKNITPLMYASAYGYIDIANLLIKNGADLNKQDFYGNTALIMAVLYNHIDIGNSLIINGADKELCDNKKFSPFIISAQNGQSDFIDMLHFYKCNIYEKNKYGFSALDASILNDNPDILKTILDYDTLNYFHNKLPVKLAYETNNRKIIPTLKEHGCKSYNFLIFKKLSIGYGTNFTYNDIMFGPSIRLYETRYNIVLYSDFFSTYWAKRVSNNLGNNNFIQFWENKNYFRYGIDKRFNLKNNFSKIKGISAGISRNHVYGKYRGSDFKPTTQILYVPNIGYFYENKIIGLNINSEFAKFSDNSFPIRLNFSFYFKINFKKLIYNQKKSEW